MKNFSDHFKGKELKAISVLVSDEGFVYHRNCSPYITVRPNRLKGRGITQSIKTSKPIIFYTPVKRFIRSLGVYSFDIILATDIFLIRFEGI